jgi:ketosteroid isomerase-like protein
VSQKNVDLVRARFEAFAQTGSWDPNQFDPDVRYHLRADLPGSETLVGRDRLMRFFSEWVEAFRDPRFDVEELIDAGDSVVAVLRLRGYLRGSNEEIAMPETWVSHLVDGKVVEQWEYSTKAEALKAVGLEG